MPLLGSNKETSKKLLSAQGAEIVMADDPPAKVSYFRRFRHLSGGTTVSSLVHGLENKEFTYHGLLYYFLKDHYPFH